MSRYFPQAGLYQVPHENCSYPETALPAALPMDASLKIVVVGALSSFKGADTLEACAVDACRQRLPLSFHLLGFAYRPLTSHPASNLQIHGAYEEAELRGLLRRMQPDLVWLPRKLPRDVQLCVVKLSRRWIANPGGGDRCLFRRLAGRSWTWLVEPDCATDALLLRLMAIRRQFVEGRAPAPVAGPPPASDLRYAEVYLAGTTIVATPPPDWPSWSRSGRSSAERGTVRRWAQEATRCRSKRPRCNDKSPRHRSSTRRTVAVRAPGLTSL